MLSDVEMKMLLYIRSGETHYEHEVLNRFLPDIGINEASRVFNFLIETGYVCRQNMRITPLGEHAVQTYLASQDELKRLKKEKRADRIWIFITGIVTGGIGAELLRFILSQILSK